MADLATLVDLWPDALSPDERAAVRAAVQADASLAHGLRSLDAAEAALRLRLDADAGEDRSVFVLYALDRAGRADLLDADELARLTEARPVLDALVAALPALALVATRIGREAAEFEAAWQGALAADALPASTPSRQRAFEAPSDRSSRAPRPPQRRVARALWRTVALSSLALVIAVGGLIVQRDRAMLEAEGAGLVALAGGTTVRTMAGTHLAYPDPERTTVLRRRVQLNGDAFFDVAHTGEAFEVETPSATVSVLGTVFGIRSDAARTEVTLVEGAVDVAARAGGAVRLAPGQQTTIATGAAPATPSDVDLPAALDWSGLAVFRDTPIDDALARLAARSGTPVRADARLAGQRVTGTFDASRPLEEVLGALAVPLGATVERDADGYTLR